MARLTHLPSGATVSVSDEKASRLGREWAAIPAPSAPDATWKVPELREYAEANGIDLGEATKKSDILAAITSN